MTKTGKQFKQKGSRKQSGPYPFEFRLKVIRMHLEEGYTYQTIQQLTGVGVSTIGHWISRYRKDGESGLKCQTATSRKSSTLNSSVKEQIIDLKKNDPSRGSRRISDILKRFFFIRTSPSTVHKTLSEEGLIEKKQAKPKRNPPKPRFFERSTPNQLWQSDICTIRLAGKNAYLIGFIDDYSRYITGLGIYRSQTAVNVLETYRTAVGEYNVPKEMLTDNGRQYVNWRGKTRFQYELQKDRVKHIRSSPHHPMTLGKIERFWKTIQQEFLFRCQFTSFEDARDRTAIWVNYYNYQRPHQGIKGLCPADRFFEIQSELKKTLSQGIKENALELALRGKPKDPFYMVGRLNGQNVVIRAEKGKVKMMVDEVDGQQPREIVYDLSKQEENNASEKEDQNQTQVYGEREDQSCSHGMDRVQNRGGGLSGDEPQLDVVGSLAKPGDGRYGVSTGAEEAGAECRAERPLGTSVGQEACSSKQWFGEAGKQAGISAEEEAGDSDLSKQDPHDQTENCKPGGTCQEPGGDHNEGSGGFPDGNRGGNPSRGIP